MVDKLLISTAYADEPAIASRQFKGQAKKTRDKTPKKAVLFSQVFDIQKTPDTFNKDLVHLTDNSH